MSETEPVSRVVRPFGLLGSEYEVDDAGYRRFNAASGLVIVLAVLQLLHLAPGLPKWAYLSLMAAAIVAIAGLCWRVVRDGRKL
jgi:hypothetical protein